MKVISHRRFAIALVLIAGICVGCKAKPNRRGLPPGTYSPPPMGQMPGQAAYAHVTVQGQVRNQIVPWTEDLTLSRALVLAEFSGGRDPLMILIFRGNDVIRVETRQLLGGFKDPPLLPNDVIELRR